VLQGAGAASGSNSNIFYSFELGLVHYIGFSAEAYAYRSGDAFLANQLGFMTADLAAVDRTRTPWVVALVHKDWDMEAEGECPGPNPNPTLTPRPRTPQTHPYPKSAATRAP
jgi:hypothetical protein